MTDRDPVPSGRKQPLDIVHTESSLGWGGQEIRILTEAQGMLQRGHRVRLLCPREARIYDESGRFGVPAEELPIGRKNVRGLISLTQWVRAHKTLSGRMVFNTHSSTDSWLAAGAVQLVRGARLPIVRTRHISARVPRNRMSRWLYQRAATSIVTTGNALRVQLIEDLGIEPRRIASVPTGIDPARFTPGPQGEARAELGLPGEKKLVGIVATLRSWKGHRYLVDACAALPAGIGLVIVGDGPQREAITAAVAAHGMADRVWMAGNQVDVLPWLRALDVFALPSYANEGVPQALIQAMLVGLPCVTTSAGSISELAIDGETALVVPSEDPLALREAISRLLIDPESCVRLGVAARAHCLANYSLQQMLDRMEGVFEAAVGNVGK